MSIREAPAVPVPPPDRLSLIHSARKAVLQGECDVAATRLEPWLERSWRRCLAQGFVPEQRVSFDPVSTPAIRHLIEANQTLLRAAAPVMQSLARAIAHTRYFAILTDAQGVVIDVNGPIDHHDRLAQLIARIGVDLSEQVVGTTAIGATLAELQPVWLHRGEHFFDDTNAYTCAGAPLFGPDGRCVGMLDLTGVNVPERPALKHLVTQSALRIENALTLAQPHQMLLRLNWPGRAAGGDGDGLVCVDADGRITGTNRAAADMLSLPVGTIWPHCGDAFAVPTDALFDAARARHAAAEMPLWSGLHLQVLAQLSDEYASAMTGERPHNTGIPLKDLESAHILRAVQNARGNVMEAARALGISRATVYRKIGRR